MKKQYDFIYLTNTPSFYKVRLCEELAKKYTVLLVLYGYGAEAVNIRISGNEGGFDYCFLHEGDAGKRNRPLVFFRLLKLMARVRARRVLFSGWIAPEYNMYSFLSPVRHNAVICESSAIDSSMNGWKGLLKKAVIRRMSAALPSGTPHRALFEHICYPGDIHVTGSVGIFNMEGRGAFPHSPSSPLQYIYVGRLAPEKNLELLIREFNSNGRPLSIAGEGLQKEHLRNIAKDNIRFLGHIPNDQLPEIYEQHDVLILPSLYEPWGLVVEEALFRGLPVIASDKVGSASDMVAALKTGVVFSLSDPDGLRNAVHEVEKNYETLKRHVEEIDWNSRVDTQLKAYTSLLN